MSDNIFWAVFNVLAAVVLCFATATILNFSKHYETTKGELAKEAISKGCHFIEAAHSYQILCPESHYETHQ